MRSYIAVIHKEPGSCYGISFPQFLGCISAGDSFDEAIAMGAEALAMHIELMEEEGLAVAPPLPLEEVRAAIPDWEWDGTVAVVSLP